MKMTIFSESAKRIVETATLRLAGDYPFHASVLGLFVLLIDDRVSTMAVAIGRNRKIELRCNPSFVDGLHLDEVGAVLLHEVHHVLLGHLSADRDKYTDTWARVVAEEVSANEFIHEPLPGQPVLLSMFPFLPPMESTQQRYDRLKTVSKRIPLTALNSARGSTQTPNAPGACESGETAPTVLDDHDAWGSDEIDPGAADDLLRALVQDAAVLADTDSIPDFVKKKFGNALRGCGRGSIEEAIEAGARGRLNWVRLLRRFVGRHSKTKVTYRFPSRRLPDLVGIVPGRRRSSGRAHVLAVIDTSASMTPDLLAIINGELRRLAAEHAVTVVECDTKIHRVYRYRPIDSVVGRGGTDFRRPLAPQFLRQHRADVVVFFTDGYGPAPPKAPAVPVLWCLTPNGVNPAKWGESVQMSGKVGENRFSPFTNSSHQTKTR